MKNCIHCIEGLSIPMVNLEAIYYKGKSLYIHNVPYHLCMHCNHRDYVSMKNINQQAVLAYETFGITSINYI
ncbi:hypothetical protein JOC77_001127 [Peribacillus deserti]|uniref:YgiT-type zinc finger domain-containing protein n=1 Tax=Peribacillus deserti TaxID=673318 RepID=A0ABS2QFH0_9BACI|nr:hypothetical protein [Peribacillus deserti]